MDSFWDDQVDEVGAAMSALAVADAENIEVVLHVVCEQVVHVIPGVDTASVTMVAAEHARTAASTDRRALEIDGEQYELDDGPGPRVRSTCSGYGSHGFREIEAKQPDLYTSLVGAVLQMMRRYLTVQAMAEQTRQGDGVPSGDRAGEGHHHVRSCA